MSQAKVDARKQSKKNRKQIMAREKRKNAVGRLVGYILVIAIVAGIGWSIYQKAHPAPAYDISAFYNLVQTDSYGILSPTIQE